MMRSMILLACCASLVAIPSMQVETAIVRQPAQTPEADWPLFRRPRWSILNKNRQEIDRCPKPLSNSE